MNSRLMISVLAGSLIGLAGAMLMRHATPEGDRAPSATIPARTLQPPGATIAETVTRDRPFSYDHGGVRQRTLSPADERYNPVAFLREDDLSPRDVFESEPRDAEFAPVLERRIQAGYQDAFVKLGIDRKIIAMDVECRTLSCYTSIDVPKGDGKYVYDRINGLLLGSLHAPGLADADSPDMASVTFYTLFEPDLRDERAYRRFMEVVFAHLVASFKAEYSEERERE